MDTSDIYVNTVQVEQQRGLWTQWPEGRVSSRPLNISPELHDERETAHFF